MVLKMPRLTTPLTNTKIKQAKSKATTYELNDGYGLQLRITPNGSKKWRFVYYRPYTKKRSSMSFGSYPELTLAKARAAREIAREQLANEIDPQESRDEQARVTSLAKKNTLKHITAAWLEVKKSKVSDDHATDILRSLELHIFPYIGKTPIQKITAIETIKILQPIKAKGSLETVKRLCQRLNEVMVFALNTGLINNNPLAGIKEAFPQPIKQHLPTLKPKELPSLMSSLSTANIRMTTRCLIEWQLRTMVRPDEAAGARWDEIDLENGVWNIPSNRMKKKKAFTVPLTHQTLSLLETLREINSNSDYIFPSAIDPRKQTNSQTANTALKRMGFHNKLVSHGLRSIASTTLNEEGFDEDIIEAALSHIGKNQVRNAYNRTDYLERRKPMMEWWDNFIDEAATGNISLGFKGLRIAT